MLAATAGCDDATVHELITSNFVCDYVPWWMFQCDSEEMTARAQNVLSYGLVNAQIRCEGQLLQSTYNEPNTTTIIPVMTGFAYEARKLQDGSCFTNFHTTNSTTDPKLWSRVDTESAGCDQNISYFYTVSATGGNLHFVSTAQSYRCTGNTCTNISDSSITDLAIGSVCTGFNLAAFGVSE